MPILHIRDTQTGTEATTPMDNGVITIGRDETNDIVLEFPTVAEHHCEIGYSPQGYVVHDHDSPTGTFLGNRRIRGATLWRDGDELVIGHCRIRMMPSPIKEPPAGAAKNVPPPSHVAVAPSVSTPKRPTNGAATRLGKEAGIYKSKIRDYLVDHPDVKRMIHTSPSDDQLRVLLNELIREAATEIGLERPKALTDEILVKEMVDEILGLGPIEDLMRDDTIQEVMVNRWDQIHVERVGKGIELINRSFLDEDHLLETIRRILAPLGRHLNETTPMVDARLKDGTRVNAVIPPIAVAGACITIRKFAKDPFTMERLVQLGTINPAVARFLQYAVKTRLNVIVSGGTGCGKTCFLNGLSGIVGHGERMVIIEDTHELRFDHPNMVYLESRPANLEGKGQIPIRRLVINALRMRPDRIIVGECRGDESFDMLQAMNTGHLGSMTTVHANSPRDALLRIENMTLMAGYDLPVAAIRKQIVSALNLVLQLTRWGQRGERKVSSVCEITGLEGSTISMHELYKINEEGILVPTGAVPRFLQHLSQQERAQMIRLFGMGAER